VELYSDEQDLPPFSVLPIGDSMTHAQIYLEHVAEKLPKVSFAGTRSFNGWLAHEGRGGFASEDYVYKFQDPYAPSPFVFPKNVEGKDYFGDYTFHWQMANNWKSHPYVYCGYELQQLKDGMVYNREGKLYRQVDGKEVLFCENPEWEFNFSKYMERNQLGQIDAVSILIGTNDMLKLHYDTMEQGIARTIENVQTMIDSVRAFSKDIPIILNAPVLATSDSVAFGRCYGCDKHPKESRAIMLRYIERFLEKWDQCEDQNLFVVPMNAVLDPIRGFPKRGYSTGRYFDSPEIHVEDAIHPNKGGYSQMGDALAAMIQRIRMKKFQ
jgi:lysophospholipase L1-like esterase